MFIKEHGAAAILLSIVFMSLGFLLGKVTSHHGNHTGCKSEASCNHGDYEVGQHMIIVESMMDEGFEGDTVLTIPGGSIHLSIDGENVDVNVELESDDHHHGDHE